MQVIIPTHTSFQWHRNVHTESGTRELGQFINHEVHDDGRSPLWFNMVSIMAQRKFIFVVKLPGKVSMYPSFLSHARA